MTILLGLALGTAFLFGRIVGEWLGSLYAVRDAVAERTTAPADPGASSLPLHGPG